MVRSSIACSKCRRSKVKCVNEGVNSVCKACTTMRRDCTYPIAGSITTPKREGAPPGIKHEEGESKKRSRKVEDSGRGNSQKTAEDILDSPILTKRVWDELYSLFKQHCSTELPFLHPPTFKARFRQAAYPRDPAIPPPDLQGKVLLLGVLTLTARFLPELVAHHSSSGDPLAASEYYAEALKATFGPTSRSLTTPSLEMVQALLMLSLYDWGQARGGDAWVYVGIATKLAQTMGLPYVDDVGPSAHPYPTNEPNKNMISGEVAMEKEVRRRTWWSCFIMDRLLCAGKYRQSMINTAKLRVQLPCPDDQFLFKKYVRTEFLDSSVPREAGSFENNDGVLGWYIRLLDIFGSFSEWSYAGGRRTEALPPWEPATTFHMLSSKLKQFSEALPPSLAFTPENLSAHIEQHNATAYASMHTLYYLILIMLHREYIPFIPLRIKRPKGPLDEPTFSKKQHPFQDEFWTASTETVFKAARDIIAVVQTLRDEDALPESAQMGFAIWQAAFVCLYSSHFDYMDTGRHLHKCADLRNMECNMEWTKLTAGLLSGMAPRLKMIKEYQTTLRTTDQFFTDVKKQYYEHTHDERKAPPFTTQGGIEHYMDREKKLKEMGNIGADKIERSSIQGSRASTIEAMLSVNSDSMVGIENGSTPQSNRFTSVNHATESPIQYATHNGYHHPSQQPALVTAAGAPSSGLTSPYPLTPGPQYQHNHPYAQHVPQTQPAMAPPLTQAPTIWTEEQLSDVNSHNECYSWSGMGDNFAQVEQGQNGLNDLVAYASNGAHILAQPYSINYRLGIQHGPWDPTANRLLRKNGTSESPPQMTYSMNAGYS